MASRTDRDTTLEEFDRWSDASRDVRDVLEATAEEGGPRVSFVPDPASAPLDFLPDIVEVPVPATEGTVVPFHPEPSRKLAGGWNAVRQRLYIETLAETGSVHIAAKSAGLSARSAYALRSAPPLSPAPGTPRSSSRSANSPPSPSTAPSTAASSKSITRANWSAKSAFRASGC